MVEVVEKPKIESSVRVRESSLGLVVGKCLESTVLVGDLTQ